MSKLYSEGCGFNSYLEALIFLLHSPVSVKKKGKLHWYLLSYVYVVV